jgi:hypothetical protein
VEEEDPIATVVMVVESAPTKRGNDEVMFKETENYYRNSK